MDEIRTILFVDDSELIIKALQKGLLNDPYNCLFAGSGKAALQILENNEVQIICTDISMPELNGLELLKIVKEKYPKIVRLVLSGYTQIDMLLTAINQGEIFKFITKPWKLEEEFKSVLRQAVDYYNLHAETDRLASEAEQMKRVREEVSSGRSH